MGQPANVIDWTDGSGAFPTLDRGLVRALSTLPPSSSEEAPAAAGDSGIHLAGHAFDPTDAGEDEDEPTRPYDRASVLLLPPPGPIAKLDRATGCAVARLGALLEWVAQEEPTSVVVDLVTDFLAEVGALNQVLDGFARTLSESPSPALRASGEPLLRAVALWRANLVDHVDELALTQHDSLEGWTSLPAYSATYTLAFVRPLIDAMREWTFAARTEGSAVDFHLRDLEATIAAINGILNRAAADSAIDDVARRETAGRATAW